MKNSYVRLLPIKIQESILKELKSLGLSEEDINRGMDSKLCDLEDTIDTTKYLKK